jgi:hypothetical protein
MPMQNPATRRSRAAWRACKRAIDIGSSMRGEY